MVGREHSAVRRSADGQRVLPAGALKLWAAVGPTAGFIATYFFQRGTIEAAKADATAERNGAEIAAKQAKANLAAVASLERYLDPAARTRMPHEDKEIVDRALSIT
jgi:hypothetical protein